MFFFQIIYYFISLKNIRLKKERRKNTKLKFSSALWPHFSSVLLSAWTLLSLFSPCFHSMYGIRSYFLFVPNLKWGRFSRTIKKTHSCLSAPPTPRACSGPRPLLGPAHASHTASRATPSFLPLDGARLAVYFPAFSSFSWELIDFGEIWGLLGSLRPNR